MRLDITHISVMEHYVLWFFGLVLFFFSLKICTSQVMGIGVCSPQLAAPSGWQLTGPVLLWLQSPVCSYCSVKSTLMSFCGGKGNSGCPGVVGSASSTWHSVSLCPCCLSPRAAGGSFPIPTPFAHCAAVVSCTLSSGRAQPRAGMKDATASLGMGGQFIAFLCV